VIFEFNQIKIDTERFHLYRQDKPVSIEPLVFDLLVYLIENRDRVVTREELLDNLWEGKVVTDAALGVRLKDARKAVKDSGAKQEVIKTFHGRGYQFIAELSELAIPIASISIGEDNLKAGVSSLTDKPSIAVLPFSNMSGDPEQEYFCDGIVEDIITELSHFKDLSVIARQSSFSFRGQDIDIVDVGLKLNVHYVLEGSIRKSGNRIRVTAQLIDARTGTHVWASRFDRDLEDIFAVQDEVVRTISATLMDKVHYADHELAKRKSPSNLKAYDCVVLGLNYFYKWTFEDNQRALELFEQAVSIDPDYASAYAWLAETHFRAGMNLWSASFEKSYSLLFDFASKSVDLDDNDSHTHTALGLAYLFRGDHDLARSHLDRALALNPSNTDAMAHLARCEALSGDPKKGVEQLSEALRFNPFANYQWFAGQVHYWAGQYEEAILNLRTLSNPNALVHAFLAASYGQLGNDTEARESASLFISMAQDLVKLSGASLPHSWVEFVAGRYPFKYEKDAEHFKSGLEKAGLS
jgi:TolB-like protein/lipoprotein NlpI